MFTIYMDEKFVPIYHKISKWGNGNIVRFIYFKLFKYSLKLFCLF